MSETSWVTLVSLFITLVVAPTLAAFVSFKLKKVSEQVAEVHVLVDGRLSLALSAGLLANEQLLAKMMDEPGKITKDRKDAIKAQLAKVEQLRIEFDQQTASLAKSEELHLPEVEK